MKQSPPRLQIDQLRHNRDRAAHSVQLLQTLLTIFADGDDEIRASGVFSFPSSLQGHRGSRDSAFKRDGVGKHAFNIGNSWRSNLRGESEAIWIESDDRVVIPFPPKTERLVEEIPFGEK